MYAHLLDGDLASNHLSWQWIAGTASSKPYLFNAENVARFAPAEWHSSGTVLDTSYQALDVIARNSNPVAHMEQADPAQHTGGDASLHQHEPPLLSEPPQPLSGPRRSLDGRDIWLVHPWNVRNPHASLANDCVIVGWWPEEFFSRRRWSAARWSFVGQAMSAITTQQYFCNSATLQQALTGARRVHTYDNSHISSLLPTNIERLAAPRLFADVDHLCHSFSSWWKHVTHGIKQLTELPGFDTE